MSIVRVFQVTTHVGKEAEFEEFFRGTAVPLMKSQRGIEQLIFGLPREETPNEFCIVMVWKDLDAMKEFVGEEWRNPHILPEEAVLVAERTIKHYELLDM